MDDDRDLYSGMITGSTVSAMRTQGLIFGAGIAQELARGIRFKISPGTMYPILHGLEQRGYLRSSQERSGKSVRRVYNITASGRRALGEDEQRVRELFGELIEEKDAAWCSR